MAHELIEAAGLFTFLTPRAMIERTGLGSFARGRLSDSAWPRYRDLLVLTAGEAALTRLLTFPETVSPPLTPVVVGQGSSFIAMQKWDSTPAWPHMVEKPNDAQMWDVLLYAGDMSKVSQIAGDSVAKLLDIGFRSIVAQLNSMYQNAPFWWSARTADYGVLALFGVLWHAKASIVADPEGADARISSYLDDLRENPR